LRSLPLRQSRKMRLDSVTSCCVRASESLLATQGWSIIVLAAPRSRPQSPEIVLIVPSSQNLPESEVDYSTLRLLRLLGIGFLLTPASAAVAFNWYHLASIGTFRMAVGYFGLVFFGLLTCKFILLLLSPRKPVLFICRNGIRDTRISNELIEWRSVEEISIWQYRRQKTVILKVTPLVAKRLVPGGLKRVLSVANKALGADGLIINPAGLTMDAETLVDIFRRYRAAAVPGHLDNPVQ
jgi:hypothetical protein